MRAPLGQAPPARNARRRGRAAALVLAVSLLTGCGLDVTFEDTAHNRDLIDRYDPDNPLPDALPDAGDDAEADAEDRPDTGDAPDADDEPGLTGAPVAWGGVLRGFLVGACLDYEGLGAAPEGLALLRLYAEQLARVDLALLEDRQERVALWINAYNALTALGVTEARLQNQAFRVDDDGFSFFRQARHEVAGERLSLDMIEHVILRGDMSHAALTDLDDPALREWLQARAREVAPFDPRLHFALNCASRSCPDLRVEPFVGARLEAQLEDQTARFLANPDKGAGPEGISSLFLWFGADFEAVAPIGEFIAMHRAEGLEGVDAARFLDYDWAPNDLNPALEICALTPDGEE